MGYNSAKEQGRREVMARKGEEERRTRVVTYGFSWKTRKRNKFCRINSIRGPAKLLRLSVLYFSSFRIYTRRRFLHKLSRVCRGRSVARRMLLSPIEKIFKSEWGRRQSDTARFISRLPPPPPASTFLLPIIYFSFLLLFSLLLLLLLFYLFIFIYFASSISYFGRGVVSKRGGSWKIYEIFFSRERDRKNASRDKNSKGASWAERNPSRDSRRSPSLSKGKLLARFSNTERWGFCGIIFFFFFLDARTLVA